MGGRGFCNQKKNVFISILGCVKIRKLVETHDVLSHSDAPVLACSGKVLLQCHWDRAVGSSPVGCLVAILLPVLLHRALHAFTDLC